MIVIEGTVGVGKTTLMDLLVNEGYIPLREPVIDNPILDKFYHNRKRYSFSSQVFFLNRRFEQLQDAKRMSNVVMDRSIYGDEIFAEMLNDNREMTDIEYGILRELSVNMHKFIQKPKLLIYLDATTNEAVRRIRMRGRSYEQEVELEYWSSLNKRYNSYFTEYNESPVLRINVDSLDFKNNYNDQKYVIELIREKMKEIEEAK